MLTARAYKLHLLWIREFDNGHLDINKSLILTPTTVIRKKKHD